MSITTDQNICPKCQAPIPAGAPGGLCPKCVMAKAGETAAQRPEGMGEVPAIEQLAPIFPQLEILELIGRGGMGFVFKARQLHLDREVALKLLPEKLGVDPHFAERFTREARVLARLNHPNIVMVHDFGAAGGFYYLIMEYVEGLNLRQAMRMGRFSPEEALAIVPKVCEALQYAHEEGVLHRDIKPENLLLDTKGRVKIADFGIAKLLGEEKGSVTLTGTGTALGTPHYMAPEQLENPGQVDHRADIYSLGVVFYEMLTGELPIGRFSAPSSRADLDERVDAIVMRALAKERELRQKDARELQTEVESFTTQAKTEQARSESPARGDRPLAGKFLSMPRWGRWAVTIGAAALLLLAARSLFGPKSVRTDGGLQMVEIPIQDLVQTSNSPIVVEESPAEQLKRIRDEEAIRLAKERYEAARARHTAGEISDRDLALANRDLAVAEAKGDALKAAMATLQFAEWHFGEVVRSRNEDEKWAAEIEYAKARHAVDVVKAGTAEMGLAGADLRYAEMMLSVGRQKKHAGKISDEEYKKLENAWLQEDFRYRRIKQNQSEKK